MILIYYYTCVFLIFINKALYMLKISKGKDFLKNIYILTKEKWKKVFAWEKSMVGKRVWYSLTFLLISGGRTPCVCIHIHIILFTFNLRYFIHMRQYTKHFYMYLSYITISSNLKCHNGRAAWDILLFIFISKNSNCGLHSSIYTPEI